MIKLISYETRNRPKFLAKWAFYSSLYYLISEAAIASKGLSPWLSLSLPSWRRFLMTDALPPKPDNWSDHGRQQAILPVLSCFVVIPPHALHTHILYCSLCALRWPQRPLACDQGSQFRVFSSNPCFSYKDGSALPTCSTVPFVRFLISSSLGWNCSVTAMCLCACVLPTQLELKCIRKHLDRKLQEMYFAILGLFPC